MIEQAVFTAGVIYDQYQDHLYFQAVPVKY